jgi:hypothetical protein
MKASQGKAKKVGKLKRSGVAYPRKTRNVLGKKCR